ncbi:SpoIIE family protein phosphatase [Jatrophihabitans fulvus]
MGDEETAVGGTAAAAQPVDAIGTHGTDAETLAFERDLLSSLAEAINSDLDLRRVLQTVTDVGTEVVRARFGAFFYNDRDAHGRIYQLHVVSGAGLETFAAMPQPRITALFEPTFSGESTVRVDDVTTDPRFTALPPGHLPVRSYLAVPVVTRTGEVIGSLLFGHEEVGRFDARSERVMLVVAAQAAVAVENARLYEAEKKARHRAEEATARLALLQSVTAKLSSALTIAEASTAVTQVLVGPLGAARAGMFLRTGDEFTHVPGDTTSPHVPMLTQLGDDVPNPVRTAETTQGVAVVPSAERFAADYPQLASMLARVPATVVAVPLTVGGQVIGVWTLSWDEQRELTPADIETVMATGAQLASAVERARLFEAERAARAELDASIRAATETSRTLQRALLPRALPRLDDVAIAVRYQASSSDAEVGGDWYDVISTERGCVLMIGDVQGHNLTAAALMGQLRTALHAYLAEGHPIDSAVARANDLMLELTDDMIATCCLAEVDRDAGELRVVRAGHPMPICIGSDGAPRLLPDRVGLPLGAVPDGTWQTTALPLSGGDRIVLFTDGLIERRGRDIYAGLADLREFVRSSVGRPLEDFAQAVVDELGRQVQDDIAILVADIALPRARDGRTQQVWTAHISGPTDAVAPLRAQGRALLRAWNLKDFDYAVTLAISELTTNVLRHTGSHGTLQVQRLAGGVRISTTDMSDRLPDTDRDPDRDATTGRGMMLVQQLATRWGIERHAVGKTIWVEIDERPAAGAGGAPSTTREGTG